MKYKRVVITRHGSRDVLQVVEDNLPEPQSGQVRVKVLATGAAFTDVLMREGLYPDLPGVPFSPGYDIVGTVDQVGDGVSTPKVGQVVVAMTIIGGYAEYICLPAQDVVPVPRGVDPIEAVCLVLSYVAAYQMLHRVAKVKRGERILIHGAGGAVGSALLQLGKLKALEMFGTASQRKHEFVSSLGGIPIDYKTDDFVQRIQELTGDGVDVVFDGIGGSYLGRSYRTLRPKGRLVNYGFSSTLGFKRGRFFRLVSSLAQVSFLNLLADGRMSVFYSIALDKESYPDWFQEDLNALLNLLSEQKIKPAIAYKIPLIEAVRAHELLDSFGAMGKIILLCGNGLDNGCNG
ncbi:MULTISPECIES: medium chain dehydrogenase/reductase family protein [unclassified Coleofasciculus]|uniref:medium chain dehydrogenase/reductase family protein n=1 Tax=unclassified Coleofasciculus TaxID=2692782 RepID=UPI00187F9FB3|nr:MULTISPECIES: medium chain dehydrogenase/reductase family protein [unclassified Coleofasciculus]MBE9127601.1 zinc-binding dehydrogenase [Coleofasciculus sp. LEGE 07081]MBE9150928.1 zinc-binding dehydrogenase [Coleofasciculus sp. LEGE 07092]